MTTSSDHLRFGLFELDVRRAVLKREGKLVRLQPQPARVLTALASRAGEIVSRDELRREVWGDAYVDAEQGLNYCVRQIRAALGDKAESPSFIETVRGRGYRFIAPLASSAPAAATEARAVEAPRTGRRRDVLLIVTGAVLLLLIAGATSLRRRPVEVPVASSNAEPSPEAYAAFLQGRYQLAYGGRGAAESSLVFFRQAVELYPDFPRAWLELGRAHLAAHTSPRERNEPARTALEKALELDAESGEAHTLLGDVALFYDWNWPAARQHYEAAVRLAPDSADAHKGLAFYHSSQGHFDDAIAEVRRALELDPVSVNLHADLGFFYFRAGRFDEAVEQCRATLALASNDIGAHSCLEAAYVALGRHEEALPHARRLMRRWGADDADVARLDAAAAEAGIRWYRQWRLAGEQAKAVGASAFLLARLHAELGHVQEALDWLERARDQRSSRLPFVAIAPPFRPLHGEPRFHRLVAELGLPSP